MSIRRKVLIVAAALGLALPWAPASAHPHRPPEVSLLASGLQGSVGATVGPDGALYVAERVGGRITRIDPKTGALTTFATGLPVPPIDLGGVIDVAFLGRTAYALVTLVAPSHVVGIYRIDDVDSFTVVANLGEFSEDKLPPYPVDVPTGLQFALQPHRGGFLVSDGHHNRVLRVTLDGAVSELIAYDNVVPTGLETSGSRVYVAEAGPIPHDPSTGKVTSFRVNRPVARDVASGFSLIVDVESGRRGVLYALSQGDSPGDVPAASPALPDSGELLRVRRDGTFAVLVDGLDLPTSLDMRGDTAFITTLTGEVWKIEHLSRVDD